MNALHYANVQSTAYALFEVSRSMFWSSLPVAFLLAILMIYVSGNISGERFENLFRRLIITIALLIAFPQISSAIQGLETHLVQAFGGEESYSELFSRIGNRAKEIKEAGSFSWIRLGEIGLTIISTISFLILSIVQHFLEILQIVIWNLLHILGPLALLGCLFPSWSSVPKGIFIGMLEIALWKPLWVILGRILLAIGFGQAPADPKEWFDTAVMNFAVAGLMASTPALVRGFLSGTLAAMGGSSIQSMIGGMGGALATVPIRAIQATAATTSGATAKSTGWVGRKTLSAARRVFIGPPQNPKSSSSSKSRKV